MKLFLFSVRKQVWTKEDWEQHAPYIKQLAKPKKEIQVPPPFRKKKPLAALKRTSKLATPRKYPLDEDRKWVFTPGMKNYKATKRTKELGAPRDIEEDVHYRAIPAKIPMSALKYKASARTLALSVAYPKKGAISDLKDDPFGISKNALKAKPSARTKELAEPKEFPEVKERNQAISPAALKAKASPRIIELAEPRHGPK